MGYSASVVKKVREVFENKRKNAVILAEQHRDEVYLKCPSIIEIDRALSMTGLSVFRASLSGGKGLEEKIESIKKENLHLQSAKRELLVSLGYPEDYTDIKYSCNKCNDTGYIGINMCSCMKKALVKEAYNSSGLGKFLNTQTFKNFDLSYYSDAVSDGTSPRVQMNSILEKSKQFVSDFGKAGKDENLLFIGGTGLGKTHITTAIAKGVIDKGFDVVYDSSSNIVRSFEMQRFDKDEKAIAETQRYFDCDLLIIDDLGTEFRNSFTQSCIYNLLNTRINAGKSMIISTNIDSFSGLRTTYDERVSSRLIGSFRTFHFVGDDIRIKKVREKTN